MDLRSIGVVVTLLCAWCVPVWAKVPPAWRAVVEGRYSPAVAHKGLETAVEPLQADKLRGFVVLVRGAIPAEKAYWYISNQEYDYRPVVIDLATQQQTTRRGPVYTYLDAGQVMAIAGVSYSGNTIYLKLLSPDPYQPIARAEKHASRVGVLLGFKLPKTAFEGTPEAQLAAFESWVKPFPDRTAAERFAAELRSPKNTRTGR